WVVTLDALRPYLVAAPEQDPPPDPYLHAKRPWGLDLTLVVQRDERTTCTTRFADMYWTFAQQLAHMTVNGATVRPGDFFASGTVSGPSPRERGSLIEMIADGTESGFLADGEIVTLRGWCGTEPRGVGFGSATGTIVRTQGSF
ncbi:MAG TPA: fumarylacetoacetate hydrolase family protein, partial [Acidimicrobiia bacterium]|nr:fumarylacetoacetate hydrolase family protein [Acidimicrobiia bacterium]